MEGEHCLVQEIWRLVRSELQWRATHLAMLFCSACVPLSWEAALVNNLSHPYTSTSPELVMGQVWVVPLLSWYCDMVEKVRE